MKISSTFRHLEHTPAIDQRIQEKSEKLKKYFSGNFEIQWTCSVRDDGAHVAEIRLLGPSFDYHASAYADNLYKCFDLAVAKIERQVQKKKDKWKKNINHKHKPSFKEQQIEASQEHERYWEEHADEEDLAS